METILRDLLMAGIGTAAYSCEKALDIIDELVKRGKLTIAQGAQLNEELKRTVKPDEGQKTQSTVIEELRKAISSLSLATKQDIEELKQRIENLENR